MQNFICTTCGTQFSETHEPPAECSICEDHRQYVAWSGQQWTTLDALREAHRAGRPVCGGHLVEIHGKLCCSQCHTIVETCCD